ncbi:hypothetical protein DHW03_16445 [Pedobacter yonginense]|uniref:Peptidase M56 domain-containing protein n=1 Tax=Pedobacter yonginense TaxID=651869 RepID=A0A317EHT8_9SPHI|nr:M56 family metallopeptidase [Pedobacter yonginense]PWS26370.1 hypothetical protein DHW03_16445 [Pedobacter yonginense]
MEFKFIDLLPENWLHALGATLFHSLWLGVLLALASGLVMFTTRKATATLRYNLLTVCLCLFVGAIVLMFALQLQKPIQVTDHHPNNPVASAVNQQGVSALQVNDVQYNMSTALNDLLALWNTYAYQIVLIWFFIICIKSIQLLVGLNGIFYLRNNKVYPAGKKWEERVETLAEKLKIKQQIKIVQSGIAKMPMVVGNFKPLILVPLGLLGGLSNDQIEAILAHELAHIKRRDYLVNILQSFIEIVFFFNPAVLWVSNLIKTEREHCCDDMAIGCVNDRKNYVQALISCQEFNQNAPVFAMAIMGRKNTLLHRASRMLFNTKSTLNKMEKTILTLALVSVVVCTAAFKNVGRATKSTEKGIIKTYQVFQDTTKKSAKKKVDQASDKKVGAIEPSENRSDDSMEKAIEEKMNRTEKLLNQKEKALSVEDKKRVEEDAKIAIEDAKLAKEDAKLVIEDKKRAEADRKWAEEERKFNANQNNSQRRNQDAAYKAAQKRYEEDAKRYAKSAEAYAKRAQQYAKRSQVYGTALPPMPPAPAAPLAMPVPPTPALPPSPPAHTSTPPLPPARKAKSSSKSVTKTDSEHVVSTITETDGNGRDYTADINQDLLKDKIITNTNKLSYQLNKNSLVVNGVKQSANIHQKYKSKYLKQESHSLNYNYEIDRQN